MVLSSKQLEGAAASGTTRLLALVGGLFLYFALTGPLYANGTQPIVAVHDSEYTRGLDNINAFGGTPTGPGTTGKQWWFTDFRYFVMPEAVKEALRSDGTAFTVLGDSNIISGALLTNGVPRFPIVISLASEAIHDSEISEFTNYVAAGGFLFVGSSAFTRTTNGTPRGDFAFGNEMGIHALSPGVTNWDLNTTYTRQGNDRINSHVPVGTVRWRLPSASEEIPYGVATTPSAPHDNNQAQAPHDLWQVVNSNATVIAQGNTRPFLLVKPYGKGYFIYCAAMQPMLGNGGWAPTMYAYLTLRRSIEWAFEASGVPVAKLSPWPFQYDAAFMVRHDLESFSNEIAAVEASAQFEFTNGCTGDYYFCTGTLREDMSPTYNTNAAVAGLRRAMTNYGALIGPHNGGLTNPMIAGTPSSYDYWHWGPDEVLDFTPVPAGYSSGSNYAYVSLSRSFQDIESWLPGLMTNGMRIWCTPYYNGTREASLNIQSQLGVKITGEQKVAPFPHWSLSTQVPNKRFSVLQQPPSDWFVGADISHSMESAHTVTTIRAGVDFYYGIGALINFYSHSLSHGVGNAGAQAMEYVTYSMNTNRFPRLWPANAIKIYNWWLQRSNVQISVSHATNGVQLLTTFNIQNATHTNTTVELLTPSPSLFCDLKVYTNGVLAGTNVYRTSGQTIKLRVGNTVTNALFTYYPLGPNLTYYSESFDGTNAPALPGGWTTSGSNSPAWVSQSSVVDSAPNAAFGASAATVSQSFLVSPSFNLPAGLSQLSFRHNYDLEAGVGGVAFDGGLLEIKIGTNNFAEVISLGGLFVSGGYTHTVDNTTGNPLGGRQAWSGNSSNFVTTVLSLPPDASGKTVQFRWRLGSDSGGNRVGWRVDNVVLSGQVCLCCAGGTNAPVLPAQANRTVTEFNTLTVTNAATDADFGDTLFYALQNAPVGAVIGGNGIIVWTPGGDYGGTTNAITTIVTDGAGLTATNSFNVVVINTNGAPVLPVQTNRTVNELVALSLTNTASDPDMPGDTLSYSLLAAPAGASVSSAGVITWTPGEVQGPSTNTFTTRVVDNGVPPLSATNSFTVIVSEVNAGPTLPVQGDRSVNELTTLTVTNAATDTDVPANSISYQLLNPPPGMSISASGVITWTPAGTVGLSTNQIRTVATDNGVPPLSATNVFNVIVNDTASCQFAMLYAEGFEVISALPNLPSGWIGTNDGAQANWVVQNTNSDSGTNAAFASEAGAVGDSYLVTSNLTLQSDTATLTFRHSYDLENENGSLAYDGGVLEIKIGAGNFTDILAAGGSFAVGGYTHTISTGFASPIGGRSAWSGDSGGFVTTTVNLPSSAYGQPFQLRWRCATDNAMGGNGWYVDNVTISNFVCSAGGSNSAPVLPAQTNRTIAELSLLTVTNTASDLDSPPGSIAYQLISPPSGAAISASGVITWTPSEAQGPSTNTITTVVSDGQASATNGFTVVVTEVNVAPTLPAQTNRTIAELTSLTVTNTATDTDLPANSISYQLLNPPPGMSISASGVITWTPTEAQGPATNTLTTVVNDGTVSRTNSFNVIVTEVNVAPVLPTQTNRTIAELTLLTVTNTATDADLPANTLTYQLVSPPSGATITTSGIITWTPTEGQGPGTNTLTTIVSDGALSRTNSFSVIVTEANVAPVLPTQTNRTIAELTLLTVTNTATDADLPANTLTYQLISPPSGATITTNGVITWTPTEAQGPVTNSLTSVVSDGVLSATNSFSVIVTEANAAPVLPTQTNRTIAELTPLTVTNTATDSDLPANVLTYQLLSPPGGATITTNGVITWTPAEAQGPTTNTLTTVVSDGALSATNSFVVTVTEVNVAPALPAQTNRTIAELTLLTVTNTAIDVDLPANKLTYQLLNPPGNATINSNGVITWTPNESEGPGANTLTTVVSDGALNATNSFMVTVTEVNVAPVLPAQPDRVVVELAALVVTNAASDADLPANALTYQLVNAPAGAVIDTNGVISWTPSIAQGPSTNTITTVVSDGAATATNSFLVTVTDQNQVPVLLEQPNRVVLELTTLTVTNTASDADIPANTLSYQLLGPPSGAVITTNGVITWTPSEAQGPSTNLLTTVVNDGSASVTNSFTVVVEEVNEPPVFVIEPEDRTVTELTSLNVTNVASDPDLPANVLSYQLLDPPSGASISTNGVITWTPTETQAPGTNTIVSVVSDGLLSATNSFIVVVAEANLPPTLPSQPDRTIAELTLLAVTNTATDSDLPANVLSYQLLDSPAGASITTNGVITWTPTESQGPATNTITTLVSDGVSSATNSFTVVVTEANAAPMLPQLADLDIAELTLLRVTNTATDADLPANLLTYQLLDAPVGAVIDTNGVITWTPSESQGPGTNLITTVVNDGSASVTNRFVVTVTEVNDAPVFPVPADVTIAEQTMLVLTNAAADADLPANTLSYQLLNSPAGALINSNGVITWTPTEAQGPGTNTLITVVSDGIVSVTNSFVVVVTEVNQSPVFVLTPPLLVTPELVTFTVTNRATDPDLPGNTLVYSLITPPLGAYIDGDGVFTWRPNENQGPGTNVITTVVSDGSLSATNSFVVIVTEVNSPPFLATIQSQTVHAGTTVVLHCLAADSIGENNTLTFSFDHAPPGASINSTNGICVWPTTDADANSTNAFAVRVTDNGEPPLSDIREFTISVVARPLIQAITVSNEVATVTWSAIAGQHYVLQSSQTLSSQNWSDVGGEVIGTGVVALQTNSVSATTSQFYRVRLAP